MGVTNGCSLLVLTLTGFLGVQRGPLTAKPLPSQLWNPRQVFVRCFGQSRSAMGPRVRSIRRRALSAVRAGCRTAAGFWFRLATLIRLFVGSSGSFLFQRDKQGVLL